jgi:hypothetical protein
VSETFRFGSSLRLVGNFVHEENSSTAAQLLPILHVLQNKKRKRPRLELTPYLCLRHGIAQTQQGGRKPFEAESTTQEHRISHGLAYYGAKIGERKNVFIAKQRFTRPPSKPGGRFMSRHLDVRGG